MERVESLQWTSKKTDSVKDAKDFDLFACMIDETALRIIIDCNPEDGKLYGSVVPRLVMLRNITPEFDFKVFFSDFKFQHDKKQRRENFNICRLNGENEETYHIRVCQFE